MIKFENVEDTGFNYSVPVPVKGYEKYRVDKKGNVYNEKQKKLKAEVSNNGYIRVSLSKNQKHKHFLVHRLVALAFIPNVNNYSQVNHIDQNRQNNCVENLEWCTSLYNLNYSNIIKKASIKRKRKIICETTKEVFESINDACDKYQLHHSNIVACCNGRRKKAGGMKWKYVM